MYISLPFFVFLLRAHCFESGEATDLIRFEFLELI